MGTLNIRKLGATILVAMATVAPVSAATLPDQFYLGMNFSGIADWGTEPVWKDYMKQSRTWCPQRSGSAWGEGWPLAVDSLNWVTRLDAGQTVDCPLFGSTADNWTSMHPDTTYVVLYEGQGTFSFFNAQSWSAVSAGRLEFKAKASSAPFLQLSATTPSNYLRNIRVVSRGDETTVAQSPWRADFLNRWRQFPVIRFMDWGATNNSPVVSWSQRTRTTSQTQAMSSGVAIEHMIDYCNITLSEPWFCMPHRADDDYVRQFATIVRDRLDPRLRAYVEYSNEVWNSIFAQTHYCDSMGVAQGLGTSSAPWEAGWKYSGRRSKQIFKIWEEVFGGTSRFVRVVASQMNSYVTERKLDQDTVYKYTDAVAVAPYFGGKFNDAARLSEIATWSVDRLLDSCLADIRTDVRRGIQDHVTLVNQYSTRAGHPLRLVAYEGGQHLTTWNQNQTATNLFIAANRHTRMKDLYNTYFEMWDTLGGSLFCVFSSLCSPGVWGSWCVLETVAQDPSAAPKYQALLELIARHPAPSVEVRAQAARYAGRAFLRARGGARSIVVRSSQAGVLEVLTAGGRVLSRQLLAAHRDQLVATRLAPGAYLVRMAGPSGTSVRKVAVR